MEDNLVKIRRALRSDLDSIIELWKELFRFHEQYDRIFKVAPEGEAYYRLLINNFIEMQDAFVLVVEFQDKVIGYLAGQMKEYPHLCQPLKIGMIIDAVITSEYRGMHMGRELSETAEKIFFELGAERIELRTASGNPVSNHFWENVCGYSEFGRMLCKELPK